VRARGSTGAVGGVPARPVKVLRIISRLNVGGPAIQVITLTRRLQERGYDTTLVRGTEGPDEGNMHHLAEQHAVVPEHVASLQREIGLHDVRAVIALVRIIHRTRPAIMHTHAAKAGVVGRVAAVMSGRARPRVIVHTFHGHVFDGVFTSRWKPRVFIQIERALARVTTKFVAVSVEVREDLVKYGIAPRDQIEVVHLGFDLERFALDRQAAVEAGRRVRRELGIPDDKIVVTVVARVVQMKRIDRFLRVAQRLSSDDRLHFLIVGDGEERSGLMRTPESAGLAGKLTWAGMRHDIDAVCAASDVIVLTSDNEGTPVALIEAQASGKPVVATNVGGMATVVKDGESGFIVERDDEAGLARQILQLADDPELRFRMGGVGQKHVLATFTLDRLVEDVDRLYDGLLTDAA